MSSMSAAPNPTPRPNPSAERVLVVGCGFIGRHAAVGLADAGRDVTVLARRQPPEEVALAADVVIGDARDPVALAAALEDAGHVVWCAGGLLPPAAEADPRADEALTLEPLHTLLRLVERSSAPTITYLASGGTAYGNPATVPVPESAPARPIGAYGRVRVAAEQLLLEAHEAGRARVRVLRCANVYGEHQPADRNQGAVAVFLERVRHGREIILYGGGRAVRDFVYVGDVVGAVDALLDCDGPCLLNVGSGCGVAIRDLLAAVERTLDRPAHVRHEPGRSFDVERVVLDATRLRALIPYDPTPLEEGLARTVRAAEPAASR